MRGYTIGGLNPSGLCCHGALPRLARLLGIHITRLVVELLDPLHHQRAAIAAAMGTTEKIRIRRHMPRESGEK